MDSCQDADSEWMMHGIQMITVHQGLDAFDGGGKTEGSEENQTKQRSQDLNPGPSKSTLQTVGLILTQLKKLELKDYCIKFVSNFESS